MYPDEVKDGQNVGSEMAVVLVGNTGPAHINYLQFGHSSLPAINIRGIDLPPNGIAAVPVPVGLSGLSLEDYTISGQAAGYLPAEWTLDIFRCNAEDRYFKSWTLPLGTPPRLFRFILDKS